MAAWERWGSPHRKAMDDRCRAIAAADCKPRRYSLPARF
jgi:hypothetical protein